MKKCFGPESKVWVKLVNKMKNNVTVLRKVEGKCLNRMFYERKIKLLMTVNRQLVSLFSRLNAIIRATFLHKLSNIHKYLHVLLHLYVHTMSHTQNIQDKRSIF